MEMFESKGAVLGQADDIFGEQTLLGYNPKVICNDCGCPVTPPTINAGIMHVHSCRCGVKEIKEVGDVPDDLVEAIEEQHCNYCNQCEDCELTIQANRCPVHQSVDDSVDDAFDKVLHGMCSDEMIQQFKDIIHTALDNDIEGF